MTTGGGGAILTDDDAIAKRARFLTTQAKDDGIGYVHPEIGYNYRMNNVLAALGLAQLETIDERLARKRGNFALYEEAPRTGGQATPDRAAASGATPTAGSTRYLCADAAAKERLIETCLAADVQVRPLWYPNHLQQPYVHDAVLPDREGARLLRPPGEHPLFGHADERPGERWLQG